MGARKTPTVRHTRAVQRDRAMRPTVAPSAEAVEQRLEDLVHPAVFAQLAHYWRLGLRERTLTLPLMVAVVASLVWRQIGSVAEAARVLAREGFLWSSPVQVSEQALRLRLRTLPAEIFERVVADVLPELTRHTEARRRPLDPPLRRAREHFSAVVALDGSTLDALMRRVGLLREREKAPLGGRIAALLDVCSRQPRHVWYEPDAQAHDQRFWERSLAAVEPGMLLLIDLGFVNYPVFAGLSERGVGFVTRLKKNAAYTVEATFGETATVRDYRITLGKEAVALRLVEVAHQGRWHQYVTNVLVPAVLSGADVGALYQSRWRIEDAFHAVKRLLGLAYLVGGSANAVRLQVWIADVPSATWLLYGAVTDLCDEVADLLSMPLGRISVEMVYRGLCHFTQAVHRGKATDPAAYLAEQAASLGIVKRVRRRRRAWWGRRRLRAARRGPQAGCPCGSGCSGISVRDSRIHKLSDTPRSSRTARKTARRTMRSARARVTSPVVGSAVSGEVTAVDIAPTLRDAAIGWQGGSRACYPRMVPISGFSPYSPARRAAMVRSGSCPGRWTRARKRLERAAFVVSRSHLGLPYA